MRPTIDDPLLSAREQRQSVPVHAAAQRLIEEYLALAGHGNDVAGLIRYT